MKSTKDKIQDNKMTTQIEKKYLPFNAINEFMRDDYRLIILTEVISNLDKTPGEKNHRLGKIITRGVSIPGFRNSNLAPLKMKINNCSILFEKSADFSGLVIEVWSSLHPELRLVVKQLLEEKGWKILPLEIERSTLPGFESTWPKQDSFEELIKSTRDKASQLKESDDDICLMAIWVGNTLPYDLFEENLES